MGTKVALTVVGGEVVHRSEDAGEGLHRRDHRHGHRVLRPVARSCRRSSRTTASPSGLLVARVIFGVVNGLIKPIIKILVVPADPDDPRAVRARHQRRPAAADRLAVADLDRDRPSRSATSRRTSRPTRSSTAVIGGIASASSARSSAWWSATERVRPAARHRRRAARGRAALRDAALRHRPRDARRGGRGRPRRVPRPVASASTRSRPTTCPAVIARGRRARVRGERRVARRVGAGAAGRRAERPDHARGDRQDRRPTCAPRSARPRDGAPLALGRARVGRRGGRPGRRLGAGASGRATDSTCSTGSTRTSRPRRSPGSRSARARSKFGMTETEIARGDRGRRRAGRTAPAARDPPPRRLAARAPSTPGATPSAGRSRSPRCWRGSIETFDTLDVGGGFPVRPLGRAGAGARALRPRAAGAPRRRSRPTAGPTRLAIEPGRALVARAGWLVARVLHVRDRGGRQVVLDAGMTELIRPALYGARHPIRAR